MLYFTQLLFIMKRHEKIQQYLDKFRELPVIPHEIVFPGDIIDIEIILSLIYKFNRIVKVLDDIQFSIADIEISINVRSSSYNRFFWCDVDEMNIALLVNAGWTYIDELKELTTAKHQDIKSRVTVLKSVMSTMLKDYQERFDFLNEEIE